MTIHTFDPRNILAVILLTFGLLTMPARAQSASTTEAPVAWAAQEGASAQALTREAPPTALANIDFDALTYGQWKELGDRLTAALRWPRGDAWEEAAVQVIYLARYYGDRIDLDRASSRLLDVYLLGATSRSASWRWRRCTRSVTASRWNTCCSVCGCARSTRRACGA